MAMTVSNAFFRFANCGFNFRLFIVAPFRFEDWFPFLVVRDHLLEQKDRLQLYFVDALPLKNTDDEFIARVAEESPVAFPTEILESARAARMQVILESGKHGEVSPADRTRIILFD